MESFHTRPFPRWHWVFSRPNQRHYTLQKSEHNLACTLDLSPRKRKETIEEFSLWFDSKHRDWIVQKWLAKPYYFPHCSPGYSFFPLFRISSFLLQFRSSPPMGELDQGRLKKWKLWDGKKTKKKTESGINPYAACLWLRIVSPLRDIKTYRQGLLCLLRLSPFVYQLCLGASFSYEKKRWKTAERWEGRHLN